MFVIGQLSIGGTEKHLAMVASALVRKGWRISVYSLQGNGPVGPLLADGGVEVITPPLEPLTGQPSLIKRGVRLAVSSGHLLNTFIRRKPKIVHFLLPAAYVVGAPLAALASVPIRVMSRRSLNAYQASYPVLARAERYLHGTMTAVLGNSQSVVNELREQEGVPASKLGLIYNGLDLKQFAVGELRAQARAQLDISPHQLVFATVANLIPYKGHADILAALATAKTRLPQDWRLLVIGRDDGIGEDLMQQSAKLDLADHVVFMGPRNEIPRLLAAADIGLLCSHEEGFSNALLEGMAAGLPMIATNVGGNAEAIQDGSTGLLVPPKDPAALAQALIRLADDASLRGRLGSAAREHVFRHFSIDRCVECYDALYRTLAANRTVNDVAQIRVKEV